jgi:hypothetical protein
MAQIVNGTTYTDETPQAVVDILERYRGSRTARLAIEYGDRETGQWWSGVETGYVSRSTGSVKIPILVHNSRSMGGPGILDSCIVRIYLARGRQVLWEHPNYH